MPDFANAVPLSLEDMGKSPAPPAVESDSISTDVLDYVTPPPKKVILVDIRYCEATKGAPMPYDLADMDEGP